MPSIYIDGTSIEDFGLTLVDGGPNLAGLSVQRESAPWPGRTGSIAAPYATIGSRIHRFVVDREFGSLAERAAYVDLLYHAIGGSRELTYADQLTKCSRGVIRVYDPVIDAPRWVNLDLRITVEFESFLAQKWDDEPQSLVLSSTPIPIPCGTLPHGGRIILAGAITTEQRIKYRGITGVLLGEIIVTPSTATGECVVLSLDDESVVQIGTTGAVTEHDDWCSNASVWFRPAARDGNPFMDAWATVESTIAALYYFRRNYAT